MIPSSTFSKAASNVPPPKSNTIHNPFFSSALTPYAIEAAIGSCSNSQCLKPANLAASMVAVFWFTVNFAGTVMTTEPNVSSVTKDFKVFSTSDDNSSDEKFLFKLVHEYLVSVAIVRLNSTYVLEASLCHDFVARRLSCFIVL